MIKTVLDTNVVVSALMSPHGNPAKIMDLFFDGEIEAYYSGDILDEYVKVLSRPNLKIEPAKANGFYKIMHEAGKQIEPSASDIQLPDESDRIFYDAARESGSTLVTGNIKHYPEDGFVMTPRQFLENYFLDA